MTLAQSQFGTPPNVFSAGSLQAFFTETSGSPPPTCLSRAEGPCTVSTCNLGAPADAGAPMVASRSAGVLSLNGPGVDGGVSVTPNAQGFYMASRSEALFAPGDVLRFSATGMDVPAFNAMVTAPSAISVSAPSLTPGATFMLDRATPLTASWTGGTVGEVQVGVSTTTRQRAVNVVCRVAASQGTLTIPTAALGSLDALVSSPAAGEYGAFSLWASAEAMVQAGDYRVKLVVSNGGTAAQMNVR